MTKLQHPNGNIVDVPASKVERNLKLGYTNVNDSKITKRIPVAPPRVAAGPETESQDEIPTNEEEQI